MIEMQRSWIGRLFRMEIILAAFVLQPAMRLLFGFSTMTAESLKTQAMAFAIYSILAWFTWKRQVIATWGTSGLLVVNGGLTLVASIAGMVTPGLFGSVAAVVFVLLNLLVGAYYLYAGTVVFRQRPSWKRR